MNQQPLPRWWNVHARQAKARFIPEYSGRGFERRQIIIWWFKAAACSILN
jgi:hypothetical protein